jgi:hypothetical protein
MSEATEFLDSTPILDRLDLLKARLRSDSYLFFRRLLKSSQVEKLRAQILHALASVGWLKEGTDFLEARPGAVPHYSPGRRDNDAALDLEWFDGYKLIQRIEDFHKLAHDPALVGLMSQLLGADLIVHPRKIGRASFPGIEYPTPPHQDVTFNQACVDVLTTWIPLGDVSRDLGGLQILRGSASRGAMKARPADGVGGERVDVDDDSQDWLTAEYNAGDVLVFHAFSVHRAFPNRSNQLRLSVDYRYQSASDPIKPDTLIPHGYGRGTIPSWKQLTADWSSLSWIDVPHRIQIVQCADDNRPNSRLV